MKSNRNYTGCYTIDFVSITSAKKSIGVNCLETLGKLGTKGKMKNPIELNGKGSDISDKNMLARKAKKKLVTNKVVLSLIDYAKKKGDKEMVRSLWLLTTAQNDCSFPIISFMLHIAGTVFARYVIVIAKLK